MKNRSWKLLFVVALLIITILACGGERNVAENITIENSESINVNEPVEEAAPTAVSVKTSISDPAPSGTSIVIDDISYSIFSTVRPATDIIMAGDANNSKPFDSEEYVLVGLKATCQKGGNEECQFALKYISLIGSYEIVRLREIFLNGVEGFIESGEIKGGDSISGTLPFIIPADETDLVLIINSNFGDPSYLEIN